mmetsp:Transcript_47807/g.76123  ORF Transcript_47807/g.76123 Transcript_47807/m.76123 type:complete len:172 (+) Transcript_47807:30-545(+)
MAYLSSELDNSVYGGNSNELSGNNFNSPYTLILGVFVSLVPKLIPKILPRFVKKKEALERFDDPAYIEEIEESFKERFIANLEMFEKLIVAWQDRGINFSDFGIQSKSDDDQLVAGRPERFQNELLEGIDFLKERVEHIGDKNDRISKIADMVWNSFSVGYEALKTLMRRQ